MARLALVARTAESFMTGSSLAHELEDCRGQLGAVRPQSIHGYLLEYMLHLHATMAGWLHGQESTFQQSGQDLPTRSCIVFARADSHPEYFTDFPAVVSKYSEALVGGVDMLAVSRPWPSVCGCRAKTVNLLKSNAYALSVHLELSTCNLERNRGRQSLSLSEGYHC